jgi:hypothetical protein
MATRKPHTREKPKGTRGPELPNRLNEASPQARRMWETAHGRAVKEFGEGKLAHREAYAALEAAYQLKPGRSAKRRGPKYARYVRAAKEKKR